MWAKAPRRLSRLRQALARGAALALVLGCAGAATQAEEICVKGDGLHIQQVCLVDAPGPERYGHGVLGNTPEWDELHIHWGQKKPDGIEHRNRSDVVDPRHVFEDVAPRLMDLNGDGNPEIIVVQSNLDKGARLVVFRYDAQGLHLTATPYIGTRNRWLAPLGAADLDGDGHIELAYIDRPHLAKTLRIWRYRDGALKEIASQPGLTNHRIGEDFISGGIRSCAGVSEIITADAGWKRIIATTFTGGRIQSRDIGPYRGRQSLTKTLSCP